MMQSRSTYHHGDLPAALVRAAIELLDTDGAEADVSLRAVARKAGVSTGAPYRHFEDRSALLSSVAAVGYRELAALLQSAHPAPESIADLADIAVAYVRFAITRPGLFRVMFAGVCDTANLERVDAVEAINNYLRDVIKRATATKAPEVVAIGAWALVHGLAFLFLDGKLDATDRDQVDSHVRAVVTATLGLNL